jgi:hypothetical protein
VPYPFTDSDRRRPLAVYVEAVIAEKLRALAQAHDRSLSDECRVALKRHVEAPENEKRAAR